MVRRAAAIWLLLLVVAIAAGAVRTTVLVRRVGEPRAHVLGTLVVCLLFAVTIAATVRWVVPDLEPIRLWALGAGWTAATIVFEFLFGHFAMGHPWSRLVGDYDLTAGRVWALVLLTLLLGPATAGRWLR